MYRRREQSPEIITIMVIFIKETRERRVNNYSNRLIVSRLIKVIIIVLLTELRSSRRRRESLRVSCFTLFRSQVETLFIHSFIHNHNLKNKLLFCAVYNTIIDQQLTNDHDQHWPNCDIIQPTYLPHSPLVAVLRSDHRPYRARNFSSFRESLAY